MVRSDMSLAHCPCVCGQLPRAIGKRASPVGRFEARPTHGMPHLSRVLRLRGHLALHLRPRRAKTTQDTGARTPKPGGKIMYKRSTLQQARASLEASARGSTYGMPCHATASCLAPSAPAPAECHGVGAVNSRPGMATVTMKQCCISRGS